MKALQAIKGFLSRCLALTLFLLIAQPGFAVDNEAETLIEYDTNADTEVISLRYVISELADQDSEPRLRVYGDGTVLVHYAPYTKKAGNYWLHLSREEMAGLFQTVLRSRIVDFDSPGVKQRIAEIKQKRRAHAEEAGEPILVYEVADADITEITVRLKRYKPEGSKAATRTNVEKKIRYRGLRFDADDYPTIQALCGLANVETTLRALTERDDLIRIDE